MKSKLEFIELNSDHLTSWKYKILLGDTCVSRFETQLDKGYSLDTGEFETVYTIYKMQVFQKYRRKGVGSQIITFCEGLALQQGIHKILCWVKPYDRSLTCDNLTSFYKKNNFRFVKDRDNVYAVKDI